MKVRYLFVAIFCLLLVIAVAIGWTQYRHLRAGYEAYRALIQPGVRVAGVEVGWLTPEQARQKVWEWAAAPYYRPFTLYYQDQMLTLSPGDDLGLVIPVEEMVAEAIAASHQYDYWQGFKLWLQGQVLTLNLDVPFRLTFDESAAARFLQEVAQAHDLEAVEPMVNVQTATFFPGRPGRRLEVETAAAMINAMVPDPAQREVILPINPIEPDQSPARIEAMLSTLVPMMERPPTPPSFYTATLPISTTGGIEGTPTVSYTGPLTWTFPHFAGYKGTLTTTYAYFFEPGQPGYTFNLTRATSLVELSLRAGVTRPITFGPDPVPPPPITPGLLLPPLKTRLAQFPGVSSILVKNLDTDQVIYESNVDYVLSGMSIVKIGIMVEVYRYYGGQVDAQTHQELLDMLGSSSCNPCANRLLAALGGGSAYEGAKKVTNTMHRLGLANFYLCAPFRLEARQRQEGPIVWTAGPGAWSLGGFWLTQAETPRYDRCVRATPREMANLLEMIYRCTQDQGTLRRMYPNAITPAVCQEMIEIMAANDLRNMLGAGIPPEVKLAHKHGFAGYDVPWGDTRGEVGIVFSPGATWLISFYIWQDSPWIDFGIVQPLYRDVSNMLYNYFNPTAPFWPRPPWTPPPPENSGSGQS